MNICIFIGRLVADPELRFTPGGQAVVKIRLATNRSWKDSDGERVEEAEFTNFEAWGGRAEFLGRFKKGNRIALVGRKKTDTYESEGETKYYTKMVVYEVEPIDWPDSQPVGGAAPDAPETEDIPF